MVWTLTNNKPDSTSLTVLIELPIFLETLSPVCCASLRTQCRSFASPLQIQIPLRDAHPVARSPWLLNQAPTTFTGHYMNTTATQRRRPTITSTTHEADS